MVLIPILTPILKRWKPDKGFLMDDVFVCLGGTKVQWRSSYYGENRNDVHHQLSAGVQNKGMDVAIKYTKNT